MGSSSQAQLDAILGEIIEVKLYREQVAHERMEWDLMSSGLSSRTHA